MQIEMKGSRKKWNSAHNLAKQRGLEVVSALGKPKRTALYWLSGPELVEKSDTTLISVS